VTVASNSGQARSGTVTIAGQPFTITQAAASGPAPQCTFSVSPSSVPIGAAGGTAPLTITTTQGCAWSVSGVPSWISVSTTGAVGTGTVTLSVGANTGAARSATLTVGGESVTVTQAAAGTPCTYSINPTAFNASGSGASTNITVTTSPGCAWSTTGAPGWITVTDGIGTGSGTLTIAVQANPGAARTATLTIAERTFEVSQPAAAPACSSSLTPTSYNATPAGGAVPVTVKAGPGCAWITSNIPTWIVVTGGSGTGNGVVTVTVQPNTESARSAALIIAGQTFTVTQPAVAACSFSVSPANIQTSNSASTQTFTVTTASNCAWTAAVTTGGSWLTIVSGKSGTGGGSVEVSVDRNHDPARAGTLTIAGRLVTINQDGK